MKKFIFFAITGLGLLAYSSTSNEEIIRLANRVARVVQNRIHTLPQREQDQVERHLRAVMRIFRSELPPEEPPVPSLGYYCSASCLTSSGQPDIRYSRGASDRFEARAKQLAREALTRSFNCGAGATDLGCSPIYGGEVHHAIAACKTTGNAANLFYGVLGSGESVAHAKQMARENLTRKYNCGSGAVDVDSDDERFGSFYCTVGCLNSRGVVDPRYTVGSEGPSRVAATGNALELLRSKYNCAQGAGIDTCGN